jgi:hypothetical protein
MVLRSHLPRLDFYIRHIQSFRISVSHDIDADIPEFLLIVHALLERQTILPSLKRLYLDGTWLTQNSATAVLTSFLSPSVQLLKVQFVYPPFDQELHEIMETIHLRAPNITRFSLDFWHYHKDESLNRVFHKFLPRMSSLHMLSLPPECACDDGLLLIAQSLPQLRAIDFSQSRPNFARERQVHSPKFGFPRPRSGQNLYIPFLGGLSAADRG